MDDKKIYYLEKTDNPNWRRFLLVKLQPRIFLQTLSKRLAQHQLYSQNLAKVERDRQTNKTWLYVKNDPKTIERFGYIVGKLEGQMKMQQSPVVNGKKTDLENIVGEYLERSAQDFIFSGLGLAWLGGYCPDFINFKDRRIIEVFGEHWHSPEQEAVRVAHYKNKKFGFDCLVIWGSEIKDGSYQDKIKKWLGVK